MDRGASIEVIAEMWGIERHALSNAVKGRTFCRRERCDLPDRTAEYRQRLKDAKSSGREDLVLLEQYRSDIRRRKTKEREQCRRKTMEGRVDGEQGSLIPESPFNREDKKGVVYVNGNYGSLFSIGRDFFHHVHPDPDA